MQESPREVNLYPKLSKMHLVDPLGQLREHKEHVIRRSMYLVKCPQKGKKTTVPPSPKRQSIQLPTISVQNLHFAPQIDEPKQKVPE